MLHRISAAVVILLIVSSFARGQSLARFAQEEWNGRDFVATYDNPVFEMGGHVDGSQYTERVQWWDSYGRIRFDRKNEDSPFAAYRILTSDFNTHSPLIHATMDEFDLAVGVNWGTICDWKISSILGAGYSGTHPFVDEKGIFGIGDVTAVHPIDEHNSILLAVDYGGNNSLLPDVPLPGFAWVHHHPHLELMLGFPVNRIEWQPISKLKITANYIVPYTGSVDVEYLPWEHFGIYGNASNFFQGVVIERQNSINRQFFQMRRVEAGVRIVFNPLIDAGVGIGYAFDQTISQGYDVRSMRGVARISNVPYISIVLHGRF
jgi:hypothetical protein